MTSIPALKHDGSFSHGWSQLIKLYFQLILTELVPYYSMIPTQMTMRSQINENSELKLLIAIASFISVKCKIKTWHPEHTKSDFQTFMKDLGLIFFFSKKENNTWIHLKPA